MRKGEEGGPTLDGGRRSAWRRKAGAPEQPTTRRTRETHSMQEMVLCGQEEAGLRKDGREVRRAEGRTDPEDDDSEEGGDERLELACDLVGARIQVGHRNKEEVVLNDV